MHVPVGSLGNFINRAVYNKMKGKPMYWIRTTVGGRKSEWIKVQFDWNLPYIIERIQQRGYVTLVEWKNRFPEE